jgi:hypothetical protein
MHHQAIRTVGLKAACAGVLLGVVWSFTVRPAQADLGERRDRLSAQLDAIERYGISSGTDSGERLAELTERVERFSQALALHQSTPSIFQSVEKLAAAHGVQVHRTDPKTTQRRGDRSGVDDENKAELISDEFIIEFSGGFGPVVTFLDNLGPSAGVASISELRLSPSGPGVRGSITMTVFRTPPGTQILKSKEEVRDDS